MDPEKSLEFLNKCCDELKAMSQEEFDKRCEEAELNEDIRFVEECIEDDNFIIII
jgi:hypothetical protein